MRKSAALIVVSTLVAGPALADGFSYNHIQADFISTEVDDLDIEGEGFGVSGAVEFGPTIHGFGQISETEYDDGIDLGSLSLGLGFNHALAPALDLVSGISYERLKLKIDGFGSDVEEGYGLGVGLRGRVGDRFELNAGLKYVDFGDDLDDTTLIAGGRYYVTPALALGLDYNENDDGVSWIFSVRYDFGNRY